VIGLKAESRKLKAESRRVGIRFMNLSGTGLSNLQNGSDEPDHYKNSFGSVRAGALTAQNYSLTFNDFVITFKKIKDRSFGIVHKKQTFFLKRVLSSHRKVRKRLLPVPCSSRPRGGSHLSDLLCGGR